MTGSREEARQIFLAGLAAVDPYDRVRNEAAAIKGGRITLLAFGKAATRMSMAAMEALGARVTKGVVIDKHGYYNGELAPYPRLAVFEGGHPVPDESGMRGARAALVLASEAEADTTVLCLISGGGSALLCLPAEGIALAEKQAVTGALVRSGADITEINAVRKHISEIKGGRLAKAAAPARVISLIVSDVIGDPLGVIASGPTAPDESSFANALSVIDRYAIDCPASVRSHLEAGLRGGRAETLKPSDPALAMVDNRIIASNRVALEAAARSAGALGYKAAILTDRLAGDVSEVAAMLAREAGARRGHSPVAIIAGGEPTVRIMGGGKGGRNTELALRMAMLCDGKGITFLSAGTDGSDGPTDAAGAVADGSTIADAKAKGLDAEGFLGENDSYSFFSRAGGLIKTGPTGTNVMDLTVTLAR